MNLNDAQKIAMAAITVIFAVSGLLALAAAALNWDWFFRARNARMLVGRYSRRTARIVYAIVGILILAMLAAILLRLAGRI